MFLQGEGEQKQDVGLKARADCRDLSGKLSTFQSARMLEMSLLKKTFPIRDTESSHRAFGKDTQ